MASALALSSAMLLPLDAHALAFGRVLVQSTMGEPLRAEVDLTQVTPTEAASLKVNLAPAAAFRTAGLEYHPGLGGVTVSVQRRADGRPYVQVTGTRAVSEPYMDLVLEANWANGNAVRDYTLLFDAPRGKKPEPSTEEAITAPVVLRSETALGASAVAASSPAPAPTPATELPAKATETTRTPPPAAAVLSGAAGKSAPTQTRETPSASKNAANNVVTVRSGDTAGRIAGTNKAPAVSLEQMLVAMLRGNPQAFINGNVNLIKAGAILDIPDEEAAASIDAQEAKQTIVAQSKDFNAFRRRLAASATLASASQGQRQVTGKVQSEVKDPRGVQASTDQLTLSKAPQSSENPPDAEAKIAQERQNQATAERTSELERNIAELAKLSATSASATTPAASTATQPAAAQTPTETPPPQSTTPTSSPTESPPGPSGAAPVSEGSAPEPADGLLARLGNSPVALPAAGGLLALLAGLAALRWRQVKRKEEAPASDAAAPSHPAEDTNPDSQNEVQVNDTDAKPPLDPVPLDAFAAALDKAAESQAQAWDQDLLDTDIPTPAPALSEDPLMDSVPGLDVGMPEAQQPSTWDESTALENDRMDLDLDFSLETHPEDPPPLPLTFELDAADLAFGNATDPQPASNAEGPDKTLPDFELSFDGDRDEAETAPAPAATAFSNSALPTHMSATDLDLGQLAATDTPMTEETAADAPLETKLSLAAEFLAIGDKEGARSLAEEVLTQGTGALQAKAQAFLADLG